MQAVMTFNIKGSDRETVFKRLEVKNIAAAKTAFEAAIGNISGNIEYEFTCYIFRFKMLEAIERR